jgi:ABC superfamily ATP binding cassette transporter, ABC protein
MNNVVEINNLSFGYDKNKILKDINLVVKEKEFDLIIGENGVGKSTLLNLILGNLKSYKKIKLFGDYIDKDNHYKDISYISQNAVNGYRNFPTTVSEAVDIHLSYLKKDRDVSDYLKLVNLERCSNKRLSELSGGQLQRFGLLLALIKDAKLIILDEPTTGIDSKFSITLYELLKELSRNGKTIIMVTHNLSDAKKYADRVFEIKDGVIGGVNA